MIYLVVIGRVSSLCLELVGTLKRLSQYVNLEFDVSIVSQVGTLKRLSQYVNLEFDVSIVSQVEIS